MPVAARNVGMREDGPDAFELYVTRSFALDFLGWLLRAGAEFGVEVIGG